jgi:CheY-like chemotaxis protein
VILKKVLIVADTAANRIYLGQLFAAFNFEVTQANSGSEAVQVYEENPSFDLVVISLDLVGAVNGFTVARLIRQMVVAKKPFIIGIASNATKHSSGKTVAGAQGIDVYVVEDLFGSFAPRAATGGLSVLKGGLV